MRRKMEYLSIKAYLAENIWRPRFINGEVISNWQQGKSLEKSINELGVEGWQLISETFIQSDSAPIWQYYIGGFPFTLPELNTAGAGCWEFSIIFGDDRGWVVIWKRPIYQSARRLWLGREVI